MDRGLSRIMGLGLSKIMGLGLSKIFIPAKPRALIVMKAAGISGSTATIGIMDLGQ